MSNTKPNTMNNELLKQSAKNEAARELNMPLVTNFEDVKAIYYEGGIGSDLFDTILNRAMEIYAEKVGDEQRTEGIREGFDAARSLDSPTDVKNTEHGVEVFEPFKYLTADDYINSKRGY